MSRRTRFIVFLGTLLLVLAAMPSTFALAADTSGMPGQILDVVEDPVGDVSAKWDIRRVVLSADGSDLVVGFYLTTNLSLTYLVRSALCISFDTDMDSTTGGVYGEDERFAIGQTHVYQPHPGGGTYSDVYTATGGASVTVCDPPKLVLLRIPYRLLHGATVVRWEADYGYFIDMKQGESDWVPDESSYSSENWHTTSLATAWPTPFTDVAAGHPYQAQIVAMAKRGIVNGFTDGTFRPEKPVTRQQFAKMIVKALGLTVTGSEVCPFTDVGENPDANEPFYPDKYVAVCAANGITTGKTSTTFDPTGNVTRAQLVTMVARSADLAEPPEDYTAPFPDFSSVHYPWARRAAFAGLLDGLQGMDTAFNFTTAATRGEVCVLLYNLLAR
jgi:hypothetical protein